MREKGKAEWSKNQIQVSTGDQWDKWCEEGDTGGEWGVGVLYAWNPIISSTVNLVSPSFWNGDHRGCKVESQYPFLIPKCDRK